MRNKIYSQCTQIATLIHAISYISKDSNGCKLVKSRKKKEKSIRTTSEILRKFLTTPNLKSVYNKK